jgi:hypothetical protein
MRAMALGGLVLTDLDDAARRERGLGTGELALLVKGMGQFNQHGMAKKVGFLKEDVLVAVGGLTERLTEAELIGRLLRTRMAGERVEVTVRRGADRVTLSLPMQ